VAQPGEWPKPVTRLATVARMLEWFTHACNNNRLIILASKEGNLPGCVDAGGKVERDDRMTLETDGRGNISTILSFFCVSPFSQVFFFSLPFPFWFLLLLDIMKWECSCWSENHGGERRAPVDTTKELMSYPKCRSVEVINNLARLGSKHREVNCINYQ